MNCSRLSRQRIPSLLIEARFVGALSAAAALAFLSWFKSPPPAILWALPPAIIGVNLLLWWRVYRLDTVSSAELTGHLTCDSLALLLLLWPTGAASNPFVSFLLVPVALGAVLLSRRHALWLTALCIGGYSALLWHYLDAANRAKLPMMFEQHVIGMWLNFVIAAILLCLCLSLLMSKLKQREQELVHQREQLLRDDAIMATASLAAGTAHALNTPLGTIALAAESLADEPGLSADGHQDVANIASQVALCGQQLQRLAAVAHERNPQLQPLNHYAAELMRRWHTRRPYIDTTIQGLDALPGTPLRDDPALGQSLLNLLDNAADASQQAGDKRIDVCWQLSSPPAPPSLEIIIDDTGQAPNLDQLNRHWVNSTKANGLGLGLILARASIHRLGGQLHFKTNQQGGTRTHIQLPLDAICADCADQEALT